MYRLGPRYKKFCTGSCHRQKVTDFNNSLGEGFVGYEEGSPHFSFSCLVFGSLVLGFSVLSWWLSCSNLPLTTEVCRLCLTPVPDTSNITIEWGLNIKKGYHLSGQTATVMDRLWDFWDPSPYATNMTKKKEWEASLSLTFFFLQLTPKECENNNDYKW